MDLLQALFLALIQGITEWLPISSSGHLLIAQNLMGLDVPVAFDVFLHLGTLLPVVVFLRKDIVSILRSVLRFDTSDENFKLALYVITGSIPTGIIGILINRYESVFLTSSAVGVGLLITAVFLFLSKLRRGERSAGLLSSFLVGIVQGVAVWPGVSRSGSTISMALLSKIKKEDAFRLSLLLSIPALVGATLLKLNELENSGLGVQTIIGMVVAASIGYLAIRLLRKIVLSDRFNLFGIYCAIAGALVLFVLS